MNSTRRFHRVRALVAAVLVTACQGPLEGPGEPPTAPTIEVSTADAASLDALPRVFRLEVHLDAQLADTFDPEMFMLVSGELSAYYRGRLATAEVPQTLLERRIESLAWATQTGFSVQPSQVLEPGVYALGLLGWGGVAELGVVDDGSPVLHRVWPEAGGANGALYCADQALALGDAELELAPDQLAAVWRPDPLVEGRCFELSVSGPPLARVPPPRALGALVDPVPLAPLPQAAPSTAEVECLEAEAVLSAGCVAVLDDRVVVSPRQEPLLWWLAANGGHHAIETRDGLPFVMGGFAPSSDQVLWGNVYDQLGQAEPVNLRFRTLDAVPHVAINEVYADANGPEPEQEWIELVNSGWLRVDLGGWVLEDVGGQTELPAGVLEPGAFAVVVNEAYVPDADYDPLIDPFALVLSVPALGKSGLSNSGELIRLRTPEGEIVSRFPAMPAEHGQSIARRAPFSLDEDPAQFAAHAAPGSSPGAPNTLEE